MAKPFGLSDFHLKPYNGTGGLILKVRVFDSDGRTLEEFNGTIATTVTGTLASIKGSALNVQAHSAEIEIMTSDVSTTLAAWNRGALTGVALGANSKMETVNNTTYITLEIGRFIV